MKKLRNKKLIMIRLLSQTITCCIQKFGTKSAVVSISVVCSTLVLAPASAYASDLEVYRQGGVNSERTIMLMMDVSRNMGGAGVLDLLKEYPICVGDGVSKLTSTNKNDLLVTVQDLVGTIDKALLQTALGGVLDPVLSIRVDTANSTRNPRPYDRGYCTVVLTDAVANLLQNLLGPIGIGAKDYIKSTCELQTQIDVASGILAGVGVYRCYDKLTQMKDAVWDVVNGNPDKGIDPLPDSTLVGLSIFPVVSYNNTSGKLVLGNDRAGKILVPAKRLDTVGQKEAINAALASLALDKDFSVDGLVKRLVSLNAKDQGVLASVLKDVSSGVLGLLMNPLTGLTDLLSLNLTNTANSLNALLEDLGLAGNTPTASAYAETAAYLKGGTTKGTGARIVKQQYWLSGLGTQKKCNNSWDGVSLDYRCNSWKSIGWNAFDTSEIPSTDVQVVNENILSKLLGDTLLLGDLLGGLGQLLLGKSYTYVYHNKADSIYSGFNDAATTVLKDNGKDFGQNPILVEDQSVLLLFEKHRIVPNTTEALKKYIAPTGQGNTAQCPKGIYVLSGSVPNISPTTIDSLLGSTTLSAQDGIQRLMKRSLNSSSFQCRAVSLGNNKGSISKTVLNSTDYATWECIGGYADELAKNQGIKTAVVGIGRDFMFVPSAMTESELDFTALDKNKTLLGSTVPTLVSGLLDVLGGGTGLLSGLNTLLGNLFPISVNDVKNFARWGVVGGGGWHYVGNTQGIVDSIHDFGNDLIESPEPNAGVYSIPDDPLDPYLIENVTYNQVFEATNKQTWFGNVQKYGLTSDGSIGVAKWKEDKTNILQGGMVDALPQQTRKLYINRIYDTTKNKYITDNTLDQKLDEFCKGLFDKQCKDSTKNDDYRNDLVTLMGYKLQLDTNNQEGLIAVPAYKRIGMPYHSTPIKITPSATFTYTTQNGQSVTNLKREDYLVFGSTQGLLHVVNADDGKEKFAFVPNEMIENDVQRRAFSGENLSGYGSRLGNMKYGIDGLWTADVSYVSTVNNSMSLKIEQSKQVLYGGLRMGGRSYYALDLSDLNAPKLKFHINPDAAAANTALSYMGQSWSKPTIANVNWKGQTRRVMFVGGGYDTRYETKDYVTATNQIDQGAGVYMFDANTGELLWWGSVNAGGNKGGTNITDMKHSVVGRINALDRNGDGLVDHLYFADLGGKLWRIDLNANMTADTVAAPGVADKNFVKRTALLFQAPQSTERKDRFYETPTFSVYGYGSQTTAVLSLAASNRSLPITDATAGRIYNIIDRQVVKVTPADNATFTQNDLILFDKINGLTTNGVLTMATLSSNSNLKDKGWYVDFKDSKKVMGELTVMNKSLYASIYDPKDGVISGCQVGTQGTTSVYRYCLPYGVCEKGNLTNDQTGLKLGKGILPITVGSVSSSGNTRTVIGGTNRGVTEKVSTAQTIRRQIVPLKWYEQDSP